MSRSARCLLVCAAAALAVLAAGPLIGAEPVDFERAWREYLSRPSAEWSADARILALRVPRVLFGFLCGAALAAAGATFQTLLRNPLAEAYTLGVAAAGSFGAFLTASLAGAGAAAWGGQGPRFAALFFGLSATALVLALARRSARSDGLILAGVALNFLFGAGVVAIRHFSSPFDLAAMDRWMLGSLDVVGFGPWLGALPWLAAGATLLAWRAAALDQIAFDEDLARARGVPVAAVRRECVFAAAALAAAVVAQAGPIGFVGLLVPHALRPFTGLRHARLLPACALAGGALLVLADALARSFEWLGRGSELPTGAVTVALGAPVFLALLLRRGA